MLKIAILLVYFFMIFCKYLIFKSLKYTKALHLNSFCNVRNLYKKNIENESV